MLEKFVEDFTGDIAELNFCCTGKPCMFYGDSDLPERHGWWVLFSYKKVISDKIFQEIEINQLKAFLEDFVRSDECMEIIVEAFLSQEDMGTDLRVSTIYSATVAINSIPDQSSFSRGYTFVEDNADNFEYNTIILSLECSFVLNPLDFRGSESSNDLIGNKMAGKDEKKSKYEKGENVPLEDLPEKFQEMNEDPPESVKKLKEDMKKSAMAKRVAIADRVVRRFLARYTKGVPVPLEDLPEEFQEMNENPPESVLKIRNR